MGYAEKLLDPRWQKRRLEILNRDSWKCKLCSETVRTMHVHHEYYLRGNDPWDHPDEALISLCDWCHQFVENLKTVPGSKSGQVKDLTYLRDNFVIAIMMVHRDCQTSFWIKTGHKAFQCVAGADSGLLFAICNRIEEIEALQLPLTYVKNSSESI